jgi:hypothetical protein
LGSASFSGARIFRATIRFSLLRLLLRRQNFQGDDPVQLRLACLIDHAHPAAPEAFQDFELGEVFPDFVGRRRRLDDFRSVRADAIGGFGLGGQSDAQHAARAEPLR